MSGQQPAVRTCDQCGAGIRREEITSRAAARYKGKLLCPECVRQLMAKVAAKKAEAAAQTPPEPAPVATEGAPETADPADEPIALVDLDEESPAGTSTRIHGFSGGQVGVQHAERKYERPLLRGTSSATRCRTFHCKLTDASFKHLNDQINEWLDQNEDIEIKFALSNIGVVEGKHADPHLIITVFY